jgi:predicted amidohydrolase
MSLCGAEVITWHDYPERLRDYSGHEPLLMARCLDAHVHLLAAGYADPRAYITNSWEMGMPGAAWGRSMVLNRVGTPIADTGYEDGVATARVDLDKRKAEVYQPAYERENIFFVNNYGDRRAFAPVAAPWQPPKLPAYRKRTARIAVAWLPRGDSWVREKLPERMFRLIEKTGAIKPDLILLSEMSTSLEDPTTVRAAAKVGELAKRLGSYVAIGGIGDKDQVSLLRVWDREGKEVYSQALYWPKGYPKL